MPQTPVSGSRAVAVRHSIDDMSGHLTALFSADPDLVNAAYARQQTALVVEENNRLRAALAAKDRQHAAELEEVEQRARDDQMHDAMQAVLNWRSGAPRRNCYDMNRSYPASSDYEEEDVEGDQPIKLTCAEKKELIREQRAANTAEKTERLYQESVATKKKRFPPEQGWAHLYVNDDTPKPRRKAKTIAELLPRKSLKVAEPEKMPIWAQCVIGAGAISVLVAIVKFTGGLAA